MNMLLACNLGMSTSMLVNKLAEAGKKRGIDLHVEAVPFDKVALQANNVDILLLGPQVRYHLTRFVEQFGSKIPVIEAMNMSDYALINADNILNSALASYNTKVKK
jgi:PTS system cellobiose-specific IIB component